MTKICLSLVSSSVTEMLASVERCRQKIQMVEIRVDLLDVVVEKELRTMASDLMSDGLELIWTVRSREEGGSFSGDEDERLSLLQLGADCGVHFIDVEASSALLERIDKKNSKVVLSRHDFNGTSSDPELDLKEMTRDAVDKYKLAYKAENTHDLGKVLSLYRQERAGKIIAIAMGEWGESSRIFPAKFDMPWTYACDPSEGETAPGQFDVGELHDRYRLHEAGLETRLFCVIGDPVAHSLSPLIHNETYVVQKKDAMYGKIHVDDYDAFLEIATQFDIQGVSVTVPHKELLMKFIESGHWLAKVGAANTMIKTDDSWHIENTDIAAALDAIAEKLDCERNPEVLMLGAGGVSKALAWGMRQRGWGITLSNRTAAKAEALAKDIDAKTQVWESKSAEGFDIIVNGTAVGMSPNEDQCPMSFDGDLTGTIVFDTVYTPENTLLLQKAKAKGAIAISGREMFYRQAALQHSHWFSEEAPMELMREIISNSQS